MLKAVFTDMDGTLLKKDHTISETTKTIIRDLMNKGILIVPISARPLHGMLHITKELFPSHVPTVSLNGSYILHNDEIIYQSAVSPEHAKAVQKELEPYEVAAMYYTQMDWYAEENNQHIQKEQKITDVIIRIQPFEDTLKEWNAKQTGPNKILIAGDKEKILEIEQKLLELHGNKFNLSKSKSTYLEVMSLEASKTKAIEFLMKKYNLQREEIMAIGDNFNDKEMIQFAGVGVAMGNAPDEIKKIADYVTGTNEEDGVANALKHFFY